ncbi:MAG: histidine kinase, partial [Acidobacteria bacterium]
MFRPAILDDFGLKQTLDWFVRQFSRQSGISVDFEAEIDEGVVPSEDAIHLYRIVQEALNNAARHGKAHGARVTLKQQDGALNLEIRDDGVGFELGPQPDRTAGDGLGLTGMRERAEHLNGSLRVQSAPGKGTTISVQ